MDSLSSYIDRLKRSFNIFTVDELREFLLNQHAEEESGPWVSEPDGTWRQEQLDVRVVNRAGGEIKAGDLVTLDSDGTVRAADLASTVALLYEGSFIHASVAYQGSIVSPQARERLNQYVERHQERQRIQRQHSYQYNREKQEKRIAEEKAWKLLEKYMMPEQYFAFMEGTTVELINKAETHRLLINKKGDFTILTGTQAGTGVTESEGRIHSYTYPLGDEISAFLDWFRHKTDELIVNWNCGTYGIVKEGERR